MGYFYLLEVVGRGSETQFQVGENLNNTCSCFYFGIQIGNTFLTMTLFSTYLFSDCPTDK